MITDFGASDSPLQPTTQSERQNQRQREGESEGRRAGVKRNGGKGWWKQQISVFQSFCVGGVNPSEHTQPPSRIAHPPSTPASAPCTRHSQHINNWQHCWNHCSSPRQPRKGTAAAPWQKRNSGSTLSLLSSCSSLWPLGTSLYSGSLAFVFYANIF